MRRNVPIVTTLIVVGAMALSASAPRAQGVNKPWSMGPLQEGWEWFAFTFRDQQQIDLTRKEIEQMLLASDAVTKHASRLAWWVLVTWTKPLAAAEMTFKRIRVPGEENVDVTALLASTGRVDWREAVKR